MTAKQLIFAEGARERIRKGVDALADAVKVTLGPCGRTVILEREYGPPEIVNSGVIVPGGGVALLRARKAPSDLTLPTLDQTSGLRIVNGALEEPLRRIVANAADEPSIVLHQVDSATERTYGYNAATREYGDLLQMGVIDPAKVARLALQNAASIAALVLTTDCMVANAPLTAADAIGAAPVRDAETC